MVFNNKYNFFPENYPGVRQTIKLSFIGKYPLTPQRPHQTASFVNNHSLIKREMVLSIGKLNKIIFQQNA
jgi:hypothetical protein